MAGDFSGTGLAAVAAGSVLLYGAITGKSPLVALYTVVRGKSPTTVDQTTGLAHATASGTGLGSKPRSDFLNLPGNTGDATPGGGSGNAKIIANRLATHIHNRNAITGIIGNMTVESGLSPTANNPGEGAIGLCQWELGRRVNLQKFAASRGTTETDLLTQVDFVWHELTGGESAALLPLLAATTPEAAAATFDAMYERSSGEAREARKSAARRWYTELYGGK